MIFFLPELKATAPNCLQHHTVQNLMKFYDIKEFNFSEDNPNRSKGTKFLSDFALLRSASRLILSSSTFSDWVGILGVAKEIHCPYLTQSNGGPPSRNWAPVWYADDRYVYHDPFQKTGRWFGYYNRSLEKVIFNGMQKVSKRDYRRDKFVFNLLGDPLDSVEPYSISRGVEIPVPIKGDILPL